MGSISFTSNELQALIVAAVEGLDAIDTRTMAAIIDAHPCTTTAWEARHARQGPALRVLPPTDLDDGLNLGTLQRPVVLAALEAGRGCHSVEGDQIIAWSPLPNIGWGFVAVGDRGVIEGK